MIVKMLINALFPVVLAGCASPWQESSGPGAGSGASEQDVGLEVHSLQSGEEAAFPDADSMLAYREWGCALSEAQRIQKLRESREKADRESVKAALMLASCQPDKNPGLLAESLTEARKLEGTSASVDRLFELMEDHAKSYRVVERRLEQEQAKLQELVKGIREIEDQMRLSEDGENRE